MIPILFYPSINVCDYQTNLKKLCSEERFLKNHFVISNFVKKNVPRQFFSFCFNLTTGPPGSPHMSSGSGSRSGRRLADETSRRLVDDNSRLMEMDNSRMMNMENSHSRMLTTHQMAYEMTEYLSPPMLCRAQTDPTSTYENSRRSQPVSPPPTYDEVMKEVPERNFKFIGHYYSL